MHAAPHLDPKLAALRLVPGLAHVPARRLAKLQPLFDDVEFAPGELLVAADRPLFEAFVLVRGEVELLLGGVPIGRAGPGELVGELALVDSRPPDVTAVAMTPVRALVAGPAALASLLADAAFARAVATAYARRLRSAARVVRRGTAGRPLAG